MSRSKYWITATCTLAVVITFQMVSILLSFSSALDVHHILIKPVWVYPKPVLWTIWGIKTVMATFCITRVFVKEPSKHRSRSLKLWFVYFIIDMMWPLIFLWLGSSLAAAIVVSFMLPVIYLNILETAFIDRLSMYTLILFGLLILSKVFLHWTIYWLKINAL